MKKRIITVTLLIAFIISSCTNSNEQKKIVVNVKTDTVKVYKDDESAYFPGRIKARDDINLSFRIAGPITSIKALPGNQVIKGEVLAQIDPRDYKIQLAATEAKYNQIKDEVERVKKLYEKKGVTENEYYKAIYGLEQIKAKYNAHKNALEDTKLIAPYDGFIQKTYFSAKETVDAGMPIISMIGTSSMEIEINIPSTVYSKRDRIESLIAKSKLYPNKEYPLELLGTNRKANLNELYTVYLKLKIPENHPQLAPGMNVQVELKYKNSTQDKYLIPINALLTGKTGNSVWIYNAKESTINKREIRTDGIDNKGNAIVVEGLEKDDVVVSAGTSSLKEGQKVSPIKEYSKTNKGDIL
ncbi:MAG: efflux RND transporter periplasmic adaptor subunit [Psychroflexus halocasei]